MNWSVGEVGALSLKAARGVGLDWGIAEEASHAVCWLQSRGLSGVDALSDVLFWMDKSSLYQRQSNPLLVGAALCDHGKLPDLIEEKIYQPMLLIPYLAALLSNEVIEVSWVGNKLLVSADKVSLIKFDKLPAGEPVACMIKKVAEVLPETMPHSRVDETALSGYIILERFAKRTYAPATEQSRLSGAGAGINDND